MKEYFGKSAKKYTQANGNLIILNPQLKKIISGYKANGARNILDVGCGNGFFSELARESGIEYLGVDISPDMVSLAQKNYPDDQFIVSNAEDLVNIPDRSRDIVLCSMLIPSVESDTAVERILETLERVVSNVGYIIIATAHPCFDPYMQSIVGLRSDTEIEGSKNEHTYYQTPKKYTVNKKINNSTFTFRDNHRTLASWYNMLLLSNHKVIEFNECEPSEEMVEIDRIYYEQKKRYPTFLITITQSDFILSS